MPLPLDVEGIAIIGAEGEERPAAFGQQRDEGVQVLGDAALAQQDLQAERQLLLRFGQAAAFMAVANAAGGIGAEVAARDQWRMTVDVMPLDRKSVGQG